MRKVNLCENNTELENQANEWCKYQKELGYETCIVYVPIGIACDDGRISATQALFGNNFNPKLKEYK